jgi:hypothetical protein
VGIVLLWGGFLAVLAIGTRWTYLRMAGTALIVLVILVMSGRFVVERNFHYLLAEKPVLQLAQIAREADPDDELLVVNFPSWLSPQTRRFAMGNHGVQIIPFYINIQELIYAHNDADHPALAIQFGNIRQPQPYYYGMLGEQVDYEGLHRYLKRGGPVYLTRWAADEVDLTEVGRVRSEEFDPNAAVYTFGDAIRLQVTQSKNTDGELALQFLWELDQPVTEDLTVFVHLYGPDGALLNQTDGYPIAGLAPFWLWDTGDMLSDRRLLKLPEVLSSETMSLGIGVYNPATGERLPVVDAAGAPLPDNVVILPLAAQ